MAAATSATARPWLGWLVVGASKARKLAAIRRIGRTQHGVVARDQALACGFSVSAIARAVERGEWQRLHAGIFLVDPAANPVWARVMAAVLRAPGRTWASHRSAAALWGLEVATPLRPEVTTTAGLRGGRATLHLVSSMTEVDRSLRCGIPVTAPERTLVDLAGVVAPTELEGLLIGALRRKLVTRDRLLGRAVELAARGRRGSGVIPRILGEWEGRSHPESVLEVAMLRLLRRTGLPDPTPQWDVYLGGRHVARVDFAYPEHMIAIETDGYRWHSDAASWRQDLARRNELTRAGWLVLHFTWTDVQRRSKRVAATVADAISRRNVPETGTERREKSAT